MCSNGLVATPCQSSLSVWYRFLLQDFAIEWSLSGNSSNHWRKSGNGRCHVRALGEKASEHCAATTNKARMCHFFNNSQYTQKRKGHSQCQDLETSHAVTTFTCTLPFLDRHTSHHQHTSLSKNNNLTQQKWQSCNHFPLLSTRDQSIIICSLTFNTCKQYNLLWTHPPRIMAICSFPAGSHLKGHK